MRLSRPFFKVLGVIFEEIMEKRVRKKTPVATGRVCNFVIVLHKTRQGGMHSSLLAASQSGAGNPRNFNSKNSSNINL
jgi:hypothetical protein